MKLELIREIDRVYVFKSDKLAGTLTRTEQGSIFEYDLGYRESRVQIENVDVSKVDSVAFSMPLSNSSFTVSGDNLHPFFAGLLPEGRRIKRIVTVLKTSSDDMFSLLAASGKDCIGDVYVSLTQYSEFQGVGYEVENINSVLFNDLFEKSISSENYAVRLQDSSVPGVNPKISAEMISFPLSVKKRNKRYILKLGLEKFPKLIENEHFFMQMARACGVNAAPTKIVMDKAGNHGLLVERFDRLYDKYTKKIISIHQEDACQFLNRYPQDKYRLSMRDIASGIETFSTAPVLEIGKLIALKAFSYIIANGDLHSKNISLLSDLTTGRVVLSPAYDLVSTLPYGDQQMALDFEGRRDNLKLRDFISFGEAFSVREQAVRSILNRLLKQVAPWIKRIPQIGLGKKQTDFLQRKASERMTDLA